MDFAEIALAGQVAWFEHLVRRGFDALRVEGGLAVVTGVASNTDNGIVVRSSIESGALDALLDFVDAYHVPASCVLADTARPELPAALAARGLEPFNDGIEMGRLLDDVAVMGSTVDGVEIVEVTDGRTLGDGLVARGWYDDDELERRGQMETTCGYGPSSAVRHWVAYVGDVAVGMATSFQFDDVVVLAACGVVEAYRRRGIATALTRARVAAAIATGARIAVLTPSPDGQALHERFGFQVVPAKTDRWFFLPSQEDA